MNKIIPEADEAIIYNSDGTIYHEELDMIGETIYTDDEGCYIVFEKLIPVEELYDRIQQVFYDSVMENRIGLKLHDIKPKLDIKDKHMKMRIVFDHKNYTEGIEIIRDTIGRHLHIRTNDIKCNLYKVINKRVYVDLDMYVSDSKLKSRQINKYYVEFRHQIHKIFYIANLLSILRFV